MRQPIIHLVAPGKHAGSTVIGNGVQLLEELGCQVIVGKNASGHSGYFSGTDEERTEDFSIALKNEHSMIFFARGGYGAIKVLEQLNVSFLKQQTPLIFGYSDATVFHLKMAQFNLPSIHCPMALDFPNLDKTSIKSLKKVLFQVSTQIKASSHPLNCHGEVNAPVVGGNLSVICSLLGSKHLPNFKGKILFIEEVGEALYAIDRMMMMLSLNGVLEQLAGLIVGQFTSVGDSDPSYESTYENIILQYVKKYDYPVGFNFPAGHVQHHQSFYLNLPSKLIINHQHLELQQKYQ